MRCIILFAWLLFLGQVCAATWPAADGSQVTVSNLVNQAYVVAGDTVTVPANETNIWFYRVTLNKAITLQGLGLDGVGTNSTTKIIWGRDVNSSCLAIANSAARITGFNFGYTNAFGDDTDNGLVSVSQTSYQPWRIDHCVFYNFDNGGGRAIFVSGYEGGLIDHCTFYRSTDSASQAIAVQGSQPKGSWTRPPTWGNVTNVVIEDCTIDYPGPNDSGIETYRGGRVVVRFCNIRNTLTGAHRFDSQYPPDNGGYSFELYGNTFSATLSFAHGLIVPSAGSGVVFSNLYTAVSSFTGYKPFLQNYRMRTNYYVRNMDTFYLQAGYRDFQHSTAVNGVTYHMDGNRGTHDGANNSAVLSDSTQSWTNSSWVNIRVWNMTDNSFGQITANTSTTASMTLSGGTDNDWDTGDAFIFITGGDAADGGNYYDHNFPYFPNKDRHGTHTGSNNASVLTDSVASWTVNELIGQTVWNMTDNSKASIVSNTTNTITSSGLSGGAQNDFDTGDEYIVTRASGAHTGLDSQSILTDSAQTWTTNEWVDFYIWNRTDGSHGLVTANTDTTLTTVLGEGTDRDWDIGDEYVITRGQFPLDIVGRTGPRIFYGLGGTQLTIPGSGNVPTGTKYSYSTYDPWYEWENYINVSTNIQFQVDSSSAPTGYASLYMMEGVTYFNDTVKPGYTPLTYPHPSISTTPPGTITAINPTNNAVNVPHEAVLLSWSSSDAISYDVYFDTDNPPATLVTSGTASSSYSLFPLQVDTTYFWTVIAYNMVGSNTNTFTFRTASSPAPPPSIPAPPSNLHRRNTL